MVNVLLLSEKICGFDCNVVVFELILEGRVHSLVLQDSAEASSRGTMSFLLTETLSFSFVPISLLCHVLICNL